MKVVLQSMGFNTDFQVEFCLHGKEAYEQVISTYANGMSYKFIFTDFNMPVMNGIESTIAIRNHLTEVLHIPIETQPKIVGITGHVLGVYKDQGIKAGMNEILGKPLYFD